MSNERRTTEVDRDVDELDTIAAVLPMGRREDLAGLERDIAEMKAELAGN